MIILFSVINDMTNSKNNPKNISFSCFSSTNIWTSLSLKCEFHKKNVSVFL